MTLETKRLILRPIVLADAEDIHAYSREENVGVHAGWQPHSSLDETIDIMKAIFIGQKHIFGIVRKDTGKMMGSIGLLPDPKRQNPNAKMLGYALSETCWGLGLMTEAATEIVRYGFEPLHLNLISAYCYPHNQRSKNVLKKCGFSYEGCLCQCETLFNGVTYDEECYVLLCPQK